MSSYRTPGPLCQVERPVQVADGTLCRAPSARPGPVAAAASDVSRCGTVDKLLEAMRLTLPKLPAEMREAFASLLSPENIAITAGVLGLWATSHFVGVGEVVDVVIAGAGVAMLGWQAIQVAEDIGGFITTAADARSNEELDQAAVHLARAVATIGVTVFVALLTKAGSRFGKRLGQAGETMRGEFWGRNADEWLAALGKSKAPPLVRQKLEVALKFFRERFPSRTAAQVEGYLKGMDLSQEVRVVTLSPGTEVVGYGDPGKLGLYYTKPGTDLDRLGVADANRQFMRCRVRTPVPVLESTTTGVADTWTPGRTPTFPTGSKTLAGGGGTQYVIPDAVQILELIAKP